MSDASLREQAARSLTDEILRKRAESLAVEQVEAAEESRESVLLFSLGDEWYGVRIARVREIYNDYVVTPVPCVPDYIAGVINIRGEIVSVTDLKCMMGMGRSDVAIVGDEQAPVIVIADEGVCTALMVDAIGDIVEIAAGSVEPPLSLGDRAQSEYIAGGFYTGGRLVALVSTTRILTPIGGD